MPVKLFFSDLPVLNMYAWSCIGLSLLKVGGQMIYSTCSMNPVEDEAVVAEVVFNQHLHHSL